MKAPKCPSCMAVMSKHGRTTAGRQRWRCRSCRVTGVRRIDSAAKELDAFLGWLLSRQRQSDMPGGGRTFRRRTAKFWDIWVLPPLVDEVHDVVFVDGIHLGRKAVVLIAQSPEYVLGWYVARSEHSGAWEALMRRIAPPLMVVTDGGSGFEKARRRAWPHTRVQRCTFHVYSNIRTATTQHPRLDASKGLLALGRALLAVDTPDRARAWVDAYNAWAHQWQDFLSEKTPTPQGGWEYTHKPLVGARNTINRLICRELLFTHLDPEWEEPMPATNNRIEGGVNAPLRQMLRDHRGMSLMRRIKAIYWWCYMHTENPLPPAQILATMPTDTQVEDYLTTTARTERPGPQKWGDRAVWHELHTTTPHPWTHYWD